MSDSENYALNAKPPIYTEAEMQHVRDALETLRNDFNNYRTMMQERGWNAERIVSRLDHNTATMHHLHALCSNNPAFSDGYQLKHVNDMLFMITEDNINKLKALRESQS